MSAQGLEVIEHSAQTAFEWVGELAGRLDWSSKRNALRLLRTTLHLVRDHLMINETAQLSAQLPLLIRGMFFEGWVPGRTPVRDRSAESFVQAIAAQMSGMDEYRGPEDISTVFRLLNAHISAGEIADVRASLPGGIRAYWPAP